MSFLDLPEIPDEEKILFWMRQAKEARSEMGDLQRRNAHVLANLRHLYANMINGEVRDTAQAKRIATGLLGPAISALEGSDTSISEQPTKTGSSPVSTKEN